MKKIFNKKSIIGISLLFVIGIFGFALWGYLYKKTILNFEIKSIEENYINSYSRKKFIKNIVKVDDVFNEKGFEIYIENNFDNFLKNNSNISATILDYISLYNKSYNILEDLKSKGIIYRKDFNELKNYLNHFDFLAITQKLVNINLKKNSSDILAKKSYFSGIIFELNFDYLSAEKAYLAATILNPFKMEYFSKLGNVNFKLYRFKNAIDSYLKGIKSYEYNTKNNSNELLNILYNLGNTYITIRDFSNASKTYFNLFLNSVNLNNNKYIWLSSFNMAIVESGYGNYAIAQNYLKYALKTATKLKNKNYMGLTLNTLSAIQYKYGDYESGKKNALKAIKFAKKTKDLPQLANASFNACLNYDYIPNQKELVDIYCNRSLKINNTLASVIGKPEYYLQNAFLYSFVANFRSYEKALNDYEAAYVIANNLQLFLPEIKALNGLSDMNGMLGKFDIAIDQYNKVLQLEKKLNVNFNICNNCQLAFIYWNKRDLNTAISKYKQSLKIAIENNNNLAISSSASHLGSIYMEMKNYKEASKYSKIALNANKKIYRYDHHYIKYQEYWQKAIEEKINNKEEN